MTIKLHPTFFLTCASSYFGLLPFIFVKTLHKKTPAPPAHRRTRLSLSLRYPAPLLDGDVATSLSFPTVWASRLRTLPADPGMARRSPTGAGQTRRTERGLEGGRRLRRICTFRVPGLLLFLRQEERERANQGPRTWDSPRHTGSQRDVPPPETAS